MSFLNDNEQAANIELVREVEKRPWLYDYKNANYMRKDLTEEGWMEVGKTVNLTGSQARDRWKNIRAVFVRHLKSSYVNKRGKPYYLSQHMQFALPYLKKVNITKRKCVDLMEGHDNNDDQTNDSIEPQTHYEEIPMQSSEDYSIENSLDNNPIQQTPAQSGSGFNSVFISSAKKAKQSPADLEGDPRKMFVLSLLPDLYEMTEGQMRRFKLRTLSLINDIIEESPLENLKSKSSGNNARSKEKYSYQNVKSENSNDLGNDSDNE